MVKLRSSKPSLRVRILLPLIFALLVWSFLLKIVEQNKSLYSLLFLLFDWFLVNLKIVKLDSKLSDKNLIFFEFEKILLFRGIF